MAVQIIRVDNSIKNKKVIAAVNNTAVVVLPNLGEGYALAANTVIGIATGNIYNVNGVEQIECSPIHAYAVVTYGVRANQIRLVDASYSSDRSTAQNTLNDILSKHKYIMQNLCVTALICAIRRNKGYNTMPNGTAITTVEQQVSNLYYQIKARESVLIENQLIISKQDGYDTGAASAGYTALTNITNRYGYNVAGIGVAPVVLYIIVTAVVSSIITAIVYYKLKEVKAAAQYDLALSNDFMKYFNTLTTDEQTLIMNQLKATGDSAYEQAVSETKGDNIFQKAKNYALIAAGVFSLIWVKNNIDLTQAKKAYYKK